MVENLHAEPPCAIRDATTDTAPADQAQDPSVDILTEVLIDCPACPLPRPQIALGIRHKPRRCEDEHERQVGRGVIQDTWGVAHGHSQIVGSRKIDVVVANRNIGDNPQAAGAGLEDSTVDTIGQEAHYAVHSADLIAQFVRRERRGLTVLNDVESSIV